MYRGFKGRLRAKARKRLFELELKREAAVMTIQRIYRGDKASHAVGLVHGTEVLQTLFWICFTIPFFINVSDASSCAHELENL